MSDLERGFHPVQRVVARLAKISPHRQIQLLCAISVVTVLIIVAGVLVASGSTHDSLANSNDRLVPSIDRLDAAHKSYNATVSAFQATVDASPDVRAGGIAQLTALNSSGEAAWNDFVRTSSHLPGEQKLQRAFVADRKAALASGAFFVTEPVPSAEGLASVTRRSGALLVDLTAIKEPYQTKVQRSLRYAHDQVAVMRSRMLAVSGFGILLLLVAFGVAARSARSREQSLEDLDRTLHQEAERNEFEARLQRSLDMAHSEGAVCDLVGRALRIDARDVPAELLMADTTHGHFHQATTTDELGGPGCPVASPKDCPAATWGQTQIWDSSTALDACPHLGGRATGDCSAVCVPVSIGGKTVGIVHAIGPKDDPPELLVVAKIELIARKVGERIGMLRTFSRSEAEAHTDPLTGLMNRRSLEEKVRGILEEGSTYVAAYGDLDHFKQLNDLYGHDTGDQALRLFARVLRDAVRPNDLTARYGGEEFVVVLPDCGISDAYAVINRLRAALADAQSRANLPSFTASFGIAAARPEDSFSQTLEVADAALLKAKASGRDRTVISGPESTPPAPAAAPEPAPTPTGAA